MTSGRFAQLLAVLRDPERKPLATILSEVVALSLKGGRPAGFYFTGLLHKRGFRTADHLSTRDMWGIQDVLSDRIAVDILHNKLFIHEFFEDWGIPVPRLLAYNFGDRLALLASGRWTPYNLGAPDAARHLSNTLLALSPSKSVFVKPIKESHGRGARQFSGEDLGSSSGAEGLREYLESGSFLVQTPVVQHPQLGALHPNSVNTVRVDTFRQRGTDAKMMSALLRIGVAGNRVDNIAAGGIFVGIDADRGTLKEHAYNKLARGAITFSKHPDTGVVFKDFPLPHFARVKQLAVEAANLLPPALIGWDVAITPDGAVLLEGNARYYDMQLSSIAYGGYRRHPIFQAVLEAARQKNYKI
jgi:hypothetical protein